MAEVGHGAESHPNPHGGGGKGGGFIAVFNPGKIADAASKEVAEPAARVGLDAVQVLQDLIEPGKGGGHGGGGKGGGGHH
jgi:hypothetical protein